MWLTSLKLAIVEKNTKQIDELMQNIPQLEDEQEINQAIYLTQEATMLISRLKDETSSSMRQMKKNLNFLNSTAHTVSSKLDIIS